MSANKYKCYSLELKMETIFKKNVNPALFTRTVSCSLLANWSLIAVSVVSKQSAQMTAMKQCLTNMVQSNYKNIMSRLVLSYNLAYYTL